MESLANTLEEHNVTIITVEAVDNVDQPDVQINNLLVRFLLVKTMQLNL